MPAKSKQIVKHRHRDKGMESIIEIEEMKRLEDKTKTWGSQEEEEEDDRTRCWGPCPPPVPPSDEEELEELEIT